MARRTKLHAENGCHRAQIRYEMGCAGGQPKTASGPIAGCAACQRLPRWGSGRNTQCQTKGATIADSAVGPHAVLGRIPAIQGQMRRILL